MPGYERVLESTLCKVVHGVRRELNLKQLSTLNPIVFIFLHFKSTDYLKGVQAMEVLALIFGVAAIGVWIVYIFTSAVTRKGVASSAMKVIAIVLVVLTGKNYL